MQNTIEICNGGAWPSAMISVGSRYDRLYTPWFCDGVWYNGVWYRGQFRNGLWVKGTWVNGSWLNGTWLNGIWEDGDKYGGVWCDGQWKAGVWFGGIWLNGNWIKGRLWYWVDEFNGHWGESTVSPKSHLRPKTTLSLNYAKYKNN